VDAFHKRATPVSKEILTELGLRLNPKTDVKSPKDIASNDDLRGRHVESRTPLRVALASSLPTPPTA
jgi:hypothetical protein